MEEKTYQPGEIIIQEGETSRDLFFLTEGVVEISIKEEDGTFILNEIEPPQILGEISFLNGSPRTATAKAKTQVEVFVLKHEILKEQVIKLPAWLKPLLSTLISRIRSRDKKIVELEEEILRLKENSQMSQPS